MDDVRIILISSFEEAEEFVRWCEEPHQYVTLDTETTGIDWSSRIRTVQIGDARTGWVIPFERGGWGSLVRAAYERLRGTTFLMHNFKFDQTMLAHDGLMIPDDRVVDTRIMAHIVDPTRPTGLKPLADRLVGQYSSHGQKMLDEKMRKNKWTWATVPVDVPEFWWYGGLDTVLTTRIYEMLREQVWPRFERIYDLEYACQVVLRGVEQRGVLLDKEYTEWKTSALIDEAAEIRRTFQSYFGVGNLTSSSQVAAKMMRLGWEPLVWTDTGRPSMAKKVLEGVTLHDAPYAALAEAVIRCKHLEKMTSTQYLGGYLDMVDDDGFIHPNINPIGARTGRMTIRQPALQTLHRDAIVRDAFIPRPGNKMILADYDQMEVRLTAHFTQDDNYAKVIQESEDVHRASASQIFGVPESAVTKKMRALTKNAVYAIIYGAGIDTFAVTAGVTVDEARTFMSAYHTAFPGVQAFQDLVDSTAASRLEEEGLAYVMSPAGRRHPLAEWEARGTYIDRRGVKHVDGDSYKLLNYLVQGTGADVLKKAVVDADRAGIGNYLVLLVHDELGFDVPEDEVDEVSRTIQEVMEDHDNFSVPLTVGVGVYDRWGDKYRGDS